MLSMSKFCRIIELEEDGAPIQVLLTVMPDTDEPDGDDPYILRVQTDFENGVGTIGYGFSDKEIAVGAMDEYTLEDARKAREGLKPMFE